MLRNIKPIVPKKKCLIKTKSTPLEPPCPKPLYSKLSVPWLEQQGKYIGLKIKRVAATTTFRLNGIFFFFFVSRDSLALEHRR
jgi:hypothetical protein